MKNKKILFRADSSSTIGTGHIMRDLVLAKQYPDSEIFFATQDLEGNLNSNIIESGYEVKKLSSNSIEELVTMVKNLEIDMVIIDHYVVDYKFEKELKERTDVKLIVLDDTYEKHFCDVLLNHNINADKNQYKGLVPSSSELRCGIQYTLLRDEFLNLNIQNKKIEKKDRLRVFLAMGGADSKNMNISILEEIKKLNLNIELVTTRANKNLSVLQEYIHNKENITLHIDSKNIADIIKGCDIAIVTPSVMVNEIIFFKIPFISIMVTDNQKYMYAFLKKKAFPCLKKEEISYLNNKVTSLYDVKSYDKQVETITNLISKRII